MKIAIKYLVIFAILLLAPFMFAKAASFDCAKAGTSIEKTICKDLALSVLDEKLADAYKAAVRKNVPKIKDEQRRWLTYERNKATSVEQLEQVMQWRLNAILYAIGGSASTNSPQAMERQPAVQQVSGQESYGLNGNQEYAPEPDTSFDPYGKYDVKSDAEMAANEVKSKMFNENGLGQDNIAGYINAVQAGYLDMGNGVVHSASKFDEDWPSWLQTCARNRVDSNIMPITKEAVAFWGVEDFDKYTPGYKQIFSNIIISGLLKDSGGDLNKAKATCQASGFLG